MPGEQVTIKVKTGRTMRCSRRHAEILVKLGKATIVEPVAAKPTATPAKARRTYRTRQSVAERQPDPDTAEEPPSPAAQRAAWGTSTPASEGSADLPDTPAAPPTADED